MTSPLTLCAYRGASILASSLPTNGNRAIFLLTTEYAWFTPSLTRYQHALLSLSIERLKPLWKRLHGHLGDDGNILKRRGLAEANNTAHAGLMGHHQRSTPSIAFIYNFSLKIISIPLDISSQGLVRTFLDNTLLLYLPLSSPSESNWPMIPDWLAPFGYEKEDILIGLLRLAFNYSVLPSISSFEAGSWLTRAAIFSRVISSRIQEVNNRNWLESTLNSEQDIYWVLWYILFIVCYMEFNFGAPISCE